MSTRLVVPVENPTGLKAQLSQHFGRAPYFAVVELDNKGQIKDIQNVLNRSEHFGGIGKPPEIIINLRPSAVIAYGMGPRALNMFQRARVAVLRTDKNFVEDVVASYNKGELLELTEGCHHAKHK
jgi:predicted Fe-Mo cluster-binding NifX family protein